MCAAIVAAFVVVVLVECVLCNVPFFRSLAASGDSAAAYNTLGPGLERRDDGLLEVTDPTQAYLQVAADGSSEYVRIVPVSDEVMGGVPAGSRVLRTVRVRADADRVAGSLCSVSLDSSRSLYVRAAAGRTVRVQVVEPKGSLIPFDAVRANVRVPFSVSPLRVALLVLVMVLVALWRPGSRLWKVPLNTSSVRQRVTLGVLLTVPGLVTVAAVAWQLVSAVPLSFHTDGMYTYDYDQYDHVARALLDGHAWLDLDVPDALRDADNPYDVTTRQQLLADGVSPVYWDYAFFDGRWYSYFGVVPALLLFVPYRAITSLWVDGGLMMPSGAAVPLLMFVFLVFACLLTIRVIERVRPHVSLAAVSMLCVFVVLASNAPYLWYRTNFYSVPIAASLLLSTLAYGYGWVRRTRTRPMPVAMVVRTRSNRCRCLVWLPVRCVLPRMWVAVRRLWWWRLPRSRCSGRRFVRLWGSCVPSRLVPACVGVRAPCCMRCARLWPCWCPHWLWWCPCSPITWCVSPRRSISVRRIS